MALSTQFALSVELTRLVPVGLITSTAAKAFMKLAREFQNSGSDIFVEEDLAGLLGRAKIAQNLATSFRTAVAPSASMKLFEGMTLRTGAGPTVTRSFQHTEYFAMVVQCSLLGFCHSPSSLAAVLAQVFERQMLESPSSPESRSAPSYDGILGVITACRDQTSEYRWYSLIRAVSAICGPEVDEDGAIPSVILIGGLYMFPIVQSLPEDRMVLIECETGICSLIVWAHHVLGLTVHLQTKHGQESGSTTMHTCKFGDGPAQVVIQDMLTSSMKKPEPTISMFQSSDAEHMFKLVPDPDDEVLHALVLRPLVDENGIGFCQHLLRRVEHCKIPSNLLPTLAHFAAGQALACYRRAYLQSKVVHERWSHITSDGVSHANIEGPNQALNRVFYPSREVFQAGEMFLFTAAKILLGKPELQFPVLQLYAKACTDMIYYSSYERRTSRTHEILEEHGRLSREEVDSLGPNCYRHLFNVSWAIFVFAHVRNLEKQKDTLFSVSPSILDTLKYTYLSTASDTSHVINCLFELQSGYRIEGHDAVRFYDLNSSHGWSVYRSTIDLHDPCDMMLQTICIRKGVPCRNGTVRHRIMSGPSHGTSIANIGIERKPGEMTSTESLTFSHFMSPLVSERKGMFLVSLRIKQQSERGDHVRGTSFLELHSSLGRTFLTTPCNHTKPVNERLVLPDGVYAVDQPHSSHYRRIVIDNTKRKVFVTLTAQNKAARWRAIIAALKVTRTTALLLRDNGCCFHCAIEQALFFDISCFLIL